MLCEQPMALPAMLALVFFIVVRPFDFFPTLAQFPFLYLFFFLGVLGLIVDLARGALRWTPSPALPWAVALVFWALATALLHARGTLWTAIVELSILISVYVVIAHCVTDFQSFSRLAGLILLCLMVVGAVCTHQGLQPRQCVAYVGAEGVEGRPIFLERPCTEVADCVWDSRDWDATYGCEHVGLSGTTSIQGRVRYVGTLNDPNESALAACLPIPIAIARYQRRRGPRRLVVVVLAIILGAATAVLSQSRGGQLVFITLFAVYFLKRYGLKGILAALPLCVPMVLFGGREGGDSSTTARLSCQAAGIDMFLHSPVTGVGFRQFEEYHEQTAHNSFVLVPAELGVVGMVLWGIVFWACIKICLASFKTPTGPDSEEARIWGMALLSSFAAMAVGIFFLSFAYELLLWIFLGLINAYHAALVRKWPECRVRLGGKDVAWVMGAGLTVLALLFVYIRIKGVV
ncbi:MAG: O-antigen ligase family protein [Polyangiaceae bacterium]|nr:O-antigen ligase family protein [Polyangiaceae bacterium]